MAAIMSPGGPTALALHEAFRATLEPRRFTIVAGPPGTPVGTKIITHESPRKGSR